MRSAILPAAALMLASCTAPTAIAADPVDATRTITVTGEGKSSAAPDMAVISLGVRNEAPTAAEALRQNSTEMATTISKLKQLGVADKDIQTTGLSVNPRYDYERNRSQPKVIGFTASNNVTVRLRDLSSAGSIIDEAIQSGANTLSGISFAFSDPKPLYNDARRDAVSDAKRKAKLLTDAAGVKLGKLLYIQEGYAQTPQPKMYAARMDMAETAAVPMEAGESSVNVSISMIYEIE